MRTRYKKNAHYVPVTPEASRAGCVHFQSTLPCLSPPESTGSVTDGPGTALLIQLARGNSEARGGGEEGRWGEGRSSCFNAASSLVCPSWGECVAVAMCNGTAGRHCNNPLYTA